MITMMPDVEVTTDDLPDSGGRPTGVGETVDLRAFVEERLQGLSLRSGECRYSPRGHCGLQGIGSLVSQELFPSAEGTHGNTQEIREFLTAVLPGFAQMEEVQPTFFELSSGEAQRQPTVSHSRSLTSVTSAGINNHVHRHSDRLRYAAEHE